MPSEEEETEEVSESEEESVAVESESEEESVAEESVEEAAVEEEAVVEEETVACIPRGEYEWNTAAFSGMAYQRLSAADKMAQLWDAITEVNTVICQQFL